MATTRMELRSELQAMLAPAARMKEEGLTDVQVRERLLRMGLRERSAEEVVAALRRIVAQKRKRRGLRNLIFGALWLIGGIAFTALTRNAAPGAAACAAAYGAIAAGLIQAGYGTYQLAGG